VRRAAEDLLARELHAAGGGHEARDRVAQRRLAHAVATDDRRHAAFERERHALQGVRAAIVHVQVVDGEDRLFRGCTRATVRQPGYGPGSLRRAVPAHHCLAPM
jgi:hypothetical protein